MNNADIFRVAAKVLRGEGREATNSEIASAYNLVAVYLDIQADEIEAVAQRQCHDSAEEAALRTENERLREVLTRIWLLPRPFAMTDQAFLRKVQLEAKAALHGR